MPCFARYKNSSGSSGSSGLIANYDMYICEYYATSVSMLIVYLYCYLDEIEISSFAYSSVENQFSAIYGPQSAASRYMDPMENTHVLSSACN
jgi:hypothetical protein